MNKDRWQEILDMVKTSFEVEDSGVTQSDERGGTETEFIVFSGPLGRIKLEFSTHPALLDTKTHYKKRIGAEVVVDNIYSETDTVHHLEIWRWNDANQEWEAFKTNIF